MQLQTAASIAESVVEWLLGRRLLLVIDNCDVVDWFPSPMNFPRDESEALLRRNSRFEEWRARGAQLSPDEVVVSALDALEHVTDEYSS